MLARSFRLSKKDLTRLYQKGRKVREGFLLFRILPNRCEHPRFAIIIPKKIAAKATDRNRLKRKTAEVLQNLQEKLASYDIAITYQKFPSESEIVYPLEQALSHLKES